MWPGSLIAETHDRLACKKDVVFLGRKELDELQVIIAGAEAMIFVPLFEGFGIPALEAMASGIPLVASNTTSLPEIVGEAAIKVNPKDIAAIAGGMKQVLEDSNLRAELIRKGELQVQKFSWDTTSHKLWEAMQKTINESK